MAKLIQNNKNEKMLAAWIGGGRFPHAVLIDGSHGSGRKSFAKEIALALLCEGEAPPCGECRHCIKVAKDIHPDILVYQGEGGARSFHVDRVREMREQAYLSPNEGSCKVFMLINTEEMSVQAQNALLKIIEEPPSGVYFVLICENQEQMLSTIRSRVAALTMEIPDIKGSKEVLKQKVMGKTEEEYQTAIMQSKGNIGKAIIYLEGGSEEESGYSSAVSLWDNLKKGEELLALSHLEKYHRNRSGFLEQLDYLRGLVTEDILKIGKEKSASKRGLLRLYEIIDIIDGIESSTNRNVNMLLLVTMLPARIRGALLGE